MKANLLSIDIPELNNFLLIVTKLKIVHPVSYSIIMRLAEVERHYRIDMLTYEGDASIAKNFCA